MFAIILILAVEYVLYMKVKKDQIMKDADQWIKDLDMSPLPEEGGWFKEVYRSDEFIPKNSLPDRFPGKRTFSTSIYVSGLYSRTWI